MLRAALRNFEKNLFFMASSVLSKTVATFQVSFWKSRPICCPAWPGDSSRWFLLRGSTATCWYPGPGDFWSVLCTFWQFFLWTHAIYKAADLFASISLDFCPYRVQAALSPPKWFEKYLFAPVIGGVHYSKLKIKYYKQTNIQLYVNSLTAEKMVFHKHHFSCSQIE